MHPITRRSATMKTFSRVWLSTEEQLHRLADAYTQASLIRKSIGRFQFPSDTAHLQSLVMPWARVPLAYVAQGRLTFDHTAVSFRAEPPRQPGWQVREVYSDLAFELAPSDIRTVEP